MPVTLYAIHEHSAIGLLTYGAHPSNSLNQPFRIDPANIPSLPFCDSASASNFSIGVYTHACFLAEVHV